MVGRTKGCLRVFLAAMVGATVPSSAMSAVQVPFAGAWAVRAVDGPTGNPLEGVHVAFPNVRASIVTDADGMARGHGPGGEVRVVATRLGYARLDTLVAVPATGGVIELRLERAAIALPPLTLEVERRMTSRELHHAMFDREVSVGAIGMTQTEIKAVPPLAEADLLRSLQAFAGVSSVNDYSGELFVRGGGSDQVAVLMEGAPVFGPYHMFGLFGVFNVDAVESAEFYRGSIPARWGGALSGVVSARQLTGRRGGTRFSGGLSLLGLRLAADGSAPWGGVRWLAAGRKATVDVARVAIPYSFHDMNFGLEAHPAERHRVRLSVFASGDEYAWDAGASAFPSFTSRWTNLASSAMWSWIRDDRLESGVTAYYSRYRGTRKTGGARSSDPVTTNLVSAAGVRAAVTYRGERVGGRAGAAVGAGPARLWNGGGVGGYVDGDASASYLYLSAYAEFEGWLGPLRFAPGVRTGSERRAGRTFVEPRFSVRYRARRFAVSASVDRTYQFLSVLRDAYALEPGAPMWFVHGSEQPASSADGASLSVDVWRGEDWTGSVAGWTRRFKNVPHWRPVRSRDPAGVEFHDGRARGVEAMVQRHAGRVRGWLSYQWARTAFVTADGLEYAPQWDRRHEFDGLLAANLTRSLQLALRATLGTGGPFWYPAAHYAGLRYEPTQSVKGRKPGEFLPVADVFEVWSSVQGRLPIYARLDVSARYALRWGSWDIVPYLSVVNAAARTNVLRYDFVGLDADLPGRPFTAPPGRQMPLFPSIGIDVRF